MQTMPVWEPDGQQAPPVPVMPRMPTPPRLPGDGRAGAGPPMQTMPGYGQDGGQRHEMQLWDAQWSPIMAYDRKTMGGARKWWEQVGSMTGGW